MTKSSEMPTAADIMIRDVITLSPDMTLIDAIRVLLKARISGAPVVDENGRVVGMLSEHDYLRTFVCGEYSAEDYDEAGSVGAFMGPCAYTIGPDLDLYRIAHLFLEHRVRRLPVLEGGKLVGQVSRRDLLRAIDRIRELRLRPPSPTAPGLYLSATDSSPDVIAERLE